MNIKVYPLNLYKLDVDYISFNCINHSFKSFLKYSLSQMKTMTNRKISQHIILIEILFEISIVMQSDTLLYIVHKRKQELLIQNLHYFVKIL